MQLVLSFFGLSHSSKSSEDSLGSFYFPPAAFCAEEERKGYQDLLKTWDPNPFDNFVEPAEQVRGGQPVNCLALSHFAHRNFHRFFAHDRLEPGFLNMLHVICTRKNILEILDFAGLKAGFFFTEGIESWRIRGF